MTDEIIRDENGVENMDGATGSKPVVSNAAMGPGSARLEPNAPIKFTDLKGLAERLAAAEGTPEFDALNQEFCGPDTGVVYDDETKSCGVADGFVIRDGLIVKE